MHDICWKALQMNTSAQTWPIPSYCTLLRQCRANAELLKLVIRRWIKQSDATGIPAYQLDSFCEQVRQAGNDHNISVHWDGWVLRWYKISTLAAHRKIDSAVPVP